MQKTSDDDLKLSMYDFDLPESSIASRPIEGRQNSKLLVYKAKTNEIIHTQFYHLPDFLPASSLLVLNQSKVFPCRLFAQKKSGGKAEIFILSLVSKNGNYPCLIRTTSKKKIGDIFFLPSDVTAEISELGEQGNFYVRFSCEDFISYLDIHGEIPIPPYIREGKSDEQDKSDYQTIYAKEKGSVAAPTAGLHFTPEIFHALAHKGVDTAFVTLHVGPGTFAPVKTEHILEHKMHAEEYFIDPPDLRKIQNASKIFAVGTTSLRVLESSLGAEGKFNIEAGKHYSTEIFIHPGKEVRSVSGLLTNFHLPRSTLLILVSSLIGRKKTLELYEEAKKMDYRFFSYGDAMLILRD